MMYMGCACVREDYETIDFTYIFSLIKKRILWILLAVLLGMGIMYAYVHFFVPPTYTAVISFCVDNRYADGNVPGANTTLFSYQQQMAIQELMHTDAEILKHKAVTELISEKMNGKYSPNAISSMITVSIPEASVIMDVSVTAGNPEDAQLICNYLDEFGTVKIEEITKTYIRPLKAADLPTTASTAIKKYVAIGALIGLVISCAIIIIIGMLDTTIKSEEEFKKRIDIPVLGKIPSIKSADTAKRKGY